MSYRVELKASARKDFLDLPEGTRKQVGARIGDLAREPRPPGAQALAGQLRGLMRVRVGDYRVVYQVDDAAQLVTVIRVGHRGRVYR